jgi:hypothetical protein
MPTAAGDEGFSFIGRESQERVFACSMALRSPSRYHKPTTTAAQRCGTIVSDYRLSRL